MAVNKELESFVEQNILPQYEKFGASHDVRHARSVIQESLVLAQKLDADEDMAYVIAAYHDLGLCGDRSIHHITSGNILIEDGRLCKWFSPMQLEIMKEAVEDHRASSDHEPRTIYGRIVADADRELEAETVFRRTIEYGKEHYPNMSLEEQWERFRDHLLRKYSESGYIKLWIPNSPNEARLTRLRAIVSDEKQLKESFLKIFRR